MPTRDRLDLLRACVDSLEAFRPAADFELIVLDNGSENADVLAYMESSADGRIGACSPPRPVQFSAIVNSGAREARAPFLLFLNDDVEALGPDWLGRMLAFAAAPDVGAVGAKLLYPDGRLQHGGVVLGLDGFAGHVQRAVGPTTPAISARSPGRAKCRR